MKTLFGYPWNVWRCIFKGKNIIQGPSTKTKVSALVGSIINAIKSGMKRKDSTETMYMFKRFLVWQSGDRMKAQNMPAWIGIQKAPSKSDPAIFSRHNCVFPD